MVARACIAALLFLCTSSLSNAVSRADESLVLENDFLRAEFSKADGSITRLRNKVAGLELISRPRPAPRSWAMLLAPGRLVADSTGFRYTATDDNAPTKLRFEWETEYDITVTADVELPTDSNELRMTASALNSGQHTIIGLRYPDIQGIGTLSSDGENDQLLHSTVMGAVFDNPFHLFNHDGKVPAERGMVVSRYPNGFHGSAIQLMAYYEKGKGGFYFAVQDPHATDKDLNFFKAASDSLSCELAHFNWDARSGKSLELGYPIVIGAMREGSWYEAAERYREWAVQQPWCARGPLRERVEQNDASRWLIEDTGAVAMWWPFRDDIRTRIRRTHEVLDTSVLHLELWWQNQESLATVREIGDRFGPFYFPNLALRGQATFAAHEKDAISPPITVISRDWVGMCCSQPGWRQVFAESAEDLVGDGELRQHMIWIDENKTGCAADCLYYDIGPCAGIPTHCYAENHDHPPGAGRHITHGHITTLLEAQRRASSKKGAYVPTGTECITEPFIGAYDMYFPRNAGLYLDMELWPYVRQLTWLPDGKMQTVPLIAFIYHEYLPLSLQLVHSVDPWMAPEGEGVHTWAEARCYLWGGVMSMAAVQSETHVSPERQRFLRSLTAARTEFAKDFLCYGRMQRPPQIECSTISLDHGLNEGGWLRKLRFENQQTAAKAAGLPIDESGDDPEEKSSSDLEVERWVKEMLAMGATPAGTAAIKVPSVSCSVYTTNDQRVGILLVNLVAEERASVVVPLDELLHHLPAGPVQVRRITLDGTTDMGMLGEKRSVELELPPREMVLLELR